MAASAEASAAPPGEDIKPYKIRVSSKYLELTQQKLELTRLPHESADPKSADWWEPKAKVEHLIDFWLEHYSWRDQETQLNASLPQFRTSISIATSETPVRLHFVHVRSPHANAVPLLLIPPFPFTNLSLAHLVPLFTDPDHPDTTQPFHLVMPSLPGIGFSDALPNNTPVISTSANMLDVLMSRLDYKYYLATNAGSSANSPSEVDWKLADYLAVHYQTSCLGVHLISPPLASPKFQESFVEWTRWKLASLFRAPILGYSKDDFSALRRLPPPRSTKSKIMGPKQFGLNNNGAYEPNTLAYALCDSPTGLLLFVLMIFRILGPRKEFTPSEIITFTALTWLPGPEATMRFWAHSASHVDKPERSAQRSKVGITVFLGDEEEANNEQGQELELLPRPAADTYVCPTWGNARYQVVSANREPGKAGLLAWERPNVIATGVRDLARVILAMDKRMQVSEQPGAALLEQVVVEGVGTAPAEISGTTMQVTPGSSSEVPILGSPGKKAVSSPAVVDEHLAPPTTKDTRPVTPAAKTPATTGHGLAAIGAVEQEESASNDSSPDTVIPVRET